MDDNLEFGEVPVGLKNSEFGGWNIVPNWEPDWWNSEIGGMQVSEMTLFGKKKYMIPLTFIVTVKFHVVLQSGSHFFKLNHRK